MNKVRLVLGAALAVTSLAAGGLLLAHPLWAWILLLPAILLLVMIADEGRRHEK
jgi:hypothetical protein